VDRCDNAGPCIAGKLDGRDQIGGSEIIEEMPTSPGHECRWAMRPLMFTPTVRRVDSSTLHVGVTRLSRP
jgi:hypothetical protein